MKNKILDAHNIISQLPCGILIADHENNILFASKQVPQLTGIPSRKLPGTNISGMGFRGGEENLHEAPLMWPDWELNSSMRFSASILNRQGNRIPLILSRHCSLAGDNIKLQYICIVEGLSGVNQKRDKQALPSQTNFHGLIGKAPVMQELFSLIKLASDTGVNVVIQGESGTGKELAASAIHHLSIRRKQPFIRVNCAALAETLLESELFGHVKGAFTGAYKDRTGTFEAAHKGTLLLDEIGEISQGMQAKLLRVLQEKIVVRVGDNREIPVDVRILAATNKNLRKLAAAGKFREDLFYRLNVFPMQVPALNERHSDIPLLCEHFLKKYGEETGKNIQSISSDAMRLFMNYCWPGNVRELENTIEHAFVLCQSREIQVTDLPYELRVKAVREGICAEKTVGISPQFNPVLSPAPAKGVRLNITPEQLQAEIEKHGGNKSAAARALGISKVGLWKKMKKMGMG